MRTERNAILRRKPVEMPGTTVELKGVYLLLQEIRDNITRIKNEISSLRDDLEEKGVIDSLGERFED